MAIMLSIPAPCELTNRGVTVPGTAPDVSTTLVQGMNTPSMS